MATKPETPGDRLRQARLSAGFKTIAEAARATRLHPQNWRDHEAGRIKIKPDQAIRYGRKLSVSWTWLLTGQENDVMPIIPIMGNVGTDAEIRALGPHELEEIEAPIGAQAGDLAYRIVEASIPSFLKGGLIIVRPVRRLSDALGRSAVVELADGKKLFRRVAAGSSPRLYTLYGPTIAHDPIQDAQIVSAAILRVYVEPE